jgi:hypothetical protein
LALVGGELPTSFPGRFTPEKNIHALSKIRTRNPNKRSAADPRLRHRGHEAKITILLVWADEWAWTVLDWLRIWTVLDWLRIWTVLDWLRIWTVLDWLRIWTVDGLL